MRHQLITTISLQTLTRRTRYLHEETPWGRADSVKEVAPGILQVGTPSHGGYKLDDERWAVVAQLFPNSKCTRYAPDGWLEEDCDWAYAALAHPDVFTDRDVFYAVRTIAPGSKDIYFAFARNWLASTKEGAAIMARHDAYFKANPDPTISQREFFALPGVAEQQGIQKLNAYGSEEHKAAFMALCELARPYHAERFLGEY